MMVLSQHYRKQLALDERLFLLRRHTLGYLIVKTMANYLSETVFLPVIYCPLWKISISVIILPVKTQFRNFEEVISVSLSHMNYVITKLVYYMI